MFNNFVQNDFFYQIRGIRFFFYYPSPKQSYVSLLIKYVALLHVRKKTIAQAHMVC
jgi:hypothetical protein